MWKDCENMCPYIPCHMDSQDLVFHIGYRTQSEPITWNIIHMYSSGHEGKGLNREREREKKQTKQIYFVF